MSSQPPAVYQAQGAGGGSIDQVSEEKRMAFQDWEAQLRGIDSKPIEINQKPYVYPPFQPWNVMGQGGSPSEYSSVPLHLSPASPMKTSWIENEWKDLKRSLFWVRIRGSVIPRVWFATLISMIWCALWCIFDYVAVPSVELSPPGATTVSGLIAFATSLLLGFRVNSAYERWYEGRKLWSLFKTIARNFSRHVRVFCVTALEMEWFSQAEAKKKGQPYITSKTPEEWKDMEKEFALKEFLLKLIIAYPYAILFHLRGEDPLSKPVVTQLLPTMDAEWNPTAYGLQGHLYDEAGKPIQIPCTAGLKNRYDILAGVSPDLKAKAHYQTTYVLPSSWGYPEVYNCPQQILELMARWIAKFDKEKGSLLTYLTSYTDTQSQLERILTTPLPMAYVVHLKQILFVYIFLLPIQLLRTYGWFSIFITGLVTFVMLGMESIGTEIEDPFGYDYNDLPMEDMARVMRNEVEYAMGHPLPPVSLWNTLPLGALK